MNDEPKLSFIGHLDELRLTLIRCLFFLALCFPVAYAFSPEIIEWLRREFCSGLPGLVYFQPMELFFTRLRLAFFLAFAAGFPFIVYQCWRFAAPAFGERARRSIALVVCSCSIFFFIGAAFALFGILPMVMKFSLGMATEGVNPMIGVGSFVNLAAMLAFGFGVMFQLPVLVYLVVAGGWVGVDSVRVWRPFVYVGILVAAALLTPPDVVSQLALAVPVFLLFEGGFFFARLAARGR